MHTMHGKRLVMTLVLNMRVWRRWTPYVSGSCCQRCYANTYIHKTEYKNT